MPVQIYCKRGDRYIPGEEAEESYFKELPIGVYSFQRTQTGYHFQLENSFSLPNRIYGNTRSRGDRILNSYRCRLEEGHNTGVLLGGEKGSGKTLLAMYVAEQSKLPVILVNQPYGDEKFKSHLSQIGKCVVIFDEFEKVYKEEADQASVLTLFDGFYSTKALFFVIVNNRFALNDALMNRPGRLHYMYDYGGIEQAFIEEYCKDRLKDQSMILGIKLLAASHEAFNFDQLQALVEEMNRYGESAQTAVKHLNINNESLKVLTRYSISVSRAGTEIPLTTKESIFEGNRNDDYGFGVSFQYKEGVGRRAEKKYANLRIKPEHLTKIDIEHNTYEYHSAPWTITLIKVPIGQWAFNGNNMSRTGALPNPDSYDEEEDE